MTVPGLFGILQEIAEATDKETAIAIAKIFGGGMICVPKNPKMGGQNKLIEAIGASKTKMISDHIGTGTFEIPQAGFSGTTARRLYVRNLIDRNLPISEIVKRTGYSTRQIRRIKNTALST